MARIGKQIVNWQTDKLPLFAREALNFLAKEKWLKSSSWYLAGGTALALYAGHRESQDLDFFCPEKNFSVVRVLNHFNDKIWHTDIAKEGTIYGRLKGAKVSFIAYPFFKPKEKPEFYGSVAVLTPPDIAVMKIIAISQRGKKRDFIDLYWYLTNRESLTDVLQRLPEQYPTVAHDYHHIFKSMLYFEDAENDIFPRVFFDADWKKIKAFFKKEAALAARKLLHLK